MFLLWIIIYNCLNNKAYLKGGTDYNITPWLIFCYQQKERPKSSNFGRLPYNFFFFDVVGLWRGIWGLISISFRLRNSFFLLTLPKFFFINHTGEIFSDDLRRIMLQSWSNKNFLVKDSTQISHHLSFQLRKILYRKFFNIQIRA